MDIIVDWKEAVEARLGELVSEHASAPHYALFKAARYSLLSGGKRFRPLLAIACADAYKSPISHILTPACVLELIHTYSLIHDDLPSMDNDDIRRGKPTLHKVYKEGHAILTGDFLLTYAFELLSSIPHLSPEKKIELISLLSKASGAEGMVGGQVFDLVSENQTINWEQLHWMHQRKTGALITVSLQFGAIVGSAPPSDIARITTIGHKLGLAFQIADDIQDGCSSDKDKQKATAVSLLGIEAAQKHVDTLCLEIHAAMRNLSVTMPVLEALIDQVLPKTP